MVLTGVRPSYLSVKDINSTVEEYWVVRLDWELNQGLPSSMLNEVAPRDPTDMTTAAFGTKVVLTASLPDETTFNELATEHAEVTVESFTESCGALDRGASTYENTSADSCGTGYFTPTVTVLTERKFAAGIANVGTLDNVSGPFEICVPVPQGLRFENTLVPGDPLWPMVIDAPSTGGGTVGAGTAFQLPVDSYTVDYCTDPSCQDLGAFVPIIGQYCVTVPSHPLNVDGTLHARRSLQFLSNVRIVPGSTGNVIFGAAAPLQGLATALGQAPDGAPVTEVESLNPGGWLVEGRPGLTLTAQVYPGAAIPPSATFCYDYSIDSHAFFADVSPPQLDPEGSTQPTEDVVLYQWVPRSDVTPPDAPVGFTPGNGDSVFTSASSADPEAEAIRVPHLGAADSR